MKMLRLIFCFKNSSIDTEVDSCKYFLTDINALAKTEKDKLAKVVKAMADNDPANADDIYEHHSEQYEMYDSKYVELANNGALVNAYSFFEYQLKGIHRNLDRFVVNKKGTHKKLSQLSYAENLQMGISAITGLDLSPLDTTWKKLDKYRKIRNLIVHNGSSVNEEEYSLSSKKNIDNRNLVSSFPEIRLDNSNGDFYIIDEKLIVDYLDLVAAYFKGLLGILNKLADSDIK